MTMLPPEAIDEFQALWKKRYGCELPRDQAIISAHRLFTLVKSLLDGPAPPDDWKPGMPSHSEVASEGRPSVQHQ